MGETLFTNLVEKYFQGVVNGIAEKQDKKYLFKSLLNEEFTPNLRWDSANILSAIPVADVVSLNSSLPLKSRGRLSVASGKIPKLGISYELSEEDLQNLDILQKGNFQEKEVARRLFEDTAKAIKAVDERVEFMFLRGLSTGVLLIDDDTNEGVGVRADFKYLEKNTIKAKSDKWGDTKYTPISDLKAMFAKADEDSNIIAHVYISNKYFDLLRKSDEGKLLALSYSNSGIIADKTMIPMPSKQVLLNALNDEFGAEFHIVNGKFQVQQANGTMKSVNAWEEGNIIGVPSLKVGRLVYGQVVEENHPSDGVKYAKSGSYTLISKYSSKNPPKEVTTAQANVLPIIDNVNAIYLLKADTKA